MDMSASAGAWRYEEQDTPLSIVRATFEQIADQAIPVENDPAPDTGQPVQTWRELRTRLWDRAWSGQVVSDVWVWLIRRSRTHGSQAQMVCAGLATPLMARIVSVFGPRSVEQQEDIEADVLAEFFAELARIDVQRPYVWFRLRWALFRAGHRWVEREDAAPVPVENVNDLQAVDGADQPVHAAWSPAGHPEQVLAQAVTEGVITAEAAELIAATRLHGAKVTFLAHATGKANAWSLLKTRYQGERDLVAWLTQCGNDAGDISAHNSGAVPDVADASAGNVSDIDVQGQLTVRDIQTLKLLQEEPLLTAEQVSELVFRTANTGRKRLTTLTDRGLLTRTRGPVRPGRSGVPAWQYSLSPFGAKVLAAAGKGGQSESRPFSAAARRRYPVAGSSLSPAFSSTHSRDRYRMHR